MKKGKARPHIPISQIQKWDQMKKGKAIDHIFPFQMKKGKARPHIPISQIQNEKGKGY
jgi:hypothetical protein